MALSASASISVVQLDATTYRYTITLADTGTTPIGTFWFSWLPGQGYLPDLPTFTSPVGWSAQLTDGAPPQNGYSILWTASTALQPGESLGNFSFTSTATPSVLFANSTIHSPTPVTTSVVYSGAPFSDAGFTLAATTPVVAAVSITVAVATRSEGTAGATAFTFTLTQAGDTSVSHSVNYAVTPAAVFPVDAADFVGNVLPSGTLTFAAGETTKTLTVNVAGDTDLEASENFVVTLSHPSPGLAIDIASASGKILNDDSAPPVSTTDDSYVVIEGHALTVGSAAGVLANDQGGPSLTATLLTNPSHGAMALAADGSFTYTPDSGFSGIDSFSYRASNPSGLANEQGLIYVVPVNTGATTTLDLLGRLLHLDARACSALIAQLRVAKLLQTDRLCLTMAGLIIATALPLTEPRAMAAQPGRSLRAA